jgi:hypothetical protein
MDFHPHGWATGPWELIEGDNRSKPQKLPACRKVVKPPKPPIFFQAADSDGNINLKIWRVYPLETATTWGRAVAPFAEWLAQTLWNSIRKPSDRNRDLPTRLTQRRRTEGRGKEYSFELKPVPYRSNICSGCGAVTRRGQHCQKCGRETSGNKLVELAKVGREIAQSARSQQSRSETQRRHEEAKRAWRLSSTSDWPDENTYVQEIQPRLNTVTISRLASTLNVCESYAADIRAGRRRPHQRHWRALAELAGGVV